MTETAYPLSWPHGWPRAKYTQQARFSTRGRNGYAENLTLAEARNRLAEQLDMLGARYVVMSSNVELRLDGLPRGGRPEPLDRGVAVYFRLQNKPTVLACDKWNRVADNIAALAKHIDAMRGMDRWGVGSLSQAFAGYQALPAPEQWWQVLGVSQGATAAEIGAVYRNKAREAHPDMQGGSDAAMARLNAARDAGIAAI